MYNGLSLVICIVLHHFFIRNYKLLQQSTYVRSIYDKIIEKIFPYGYNNCNLHNTLYLPFKITYLGQAFRKFNSLIQPVRKNPLDF